MQNKRLAIFNYCKKNHAILDRPGDGSVGTLFEWATRMGKAYKQTKNYKGRIAILAALMNEARVWDVFTRSLILYGQFETYAKEHVPELWGE